VPVPPEDEVPPLRRLDEVVRFAVVERRVVAGLARLDDEAELLDDAVLVRRDDAAVFDAAGLDAVERFDAVDARRVAGLRAVVRVAAPVDADDAARGLSSADTRFARPSTSLRRPFSSSSTRDSSTSRIRLAA